METEGKNYVVLKRTGKFWKINSTALKRLMETVKLRRRKFVA